MAFITLVVANLLLIAATRSQQEGLIAVLARPNRVFWTIAALALAGLAAATYVPGAADLFRFEAPSPLGAAASILAAILAVVWLEAIKRSRPPRIGRLSHGQAAAERLPEMSIERLIGAISAGRRRLVLVKKAADRAWQATDYPGIERSLFRNNESGGRSSVVRLSRGSRFPRHAHEGTEEVVVLSGTVRIGDVELAARDYLFTSPRRGTRRSSRLRCDDLRVVAKAHARSRMTPRGEQPERPGGFLV